jgi:hypothetical protein
MKIPKTGDSSYFRGWNGGILALQKMAFCTEFASPYAVCDAAVYSPSRKLTLFPGR